MGWLSSHPSSVPSSWESEPKVLEVGWSRVSDFKAAYRCGRLDLEWWKAPNEWSVVGMEDECAELQGILASRHYSFLKGRDGLAWSPNPKGVFTIASGYWELLNRGLEEGEVN